SSSTYVYTLTLHDALPICRSCRRARTHTGDRTLRGALAPRAAARTTGHRRDRRGARGAGRCRARETIRPRSRLLDSRKRALSFRLPCAYRNPFFDEQGVVHGDPGALPAGLGPAHARNGLRDAPCRAETLVGVEPRREATRDGAQAIGAFGDRRAHRALELAFGIDGVHVDHVGLGGFAAPLHRR